MTEVCALRMAKRDAQTQAGERAPVQPPAPDSGHAGETEITNPSVG